MQEALVSYVDLTVYASKTIGPVSI